MSSEHSFSIASHRKRAAVIASALLTRLRKVRKGSSPNISRILIELSRLEKRMPSVSAEIGSRYLKSLAMLEPLTDSGERLVSESEALLHLAVGESEASFVIAGTTELLKASFDYLDQWRNEIQDHAAALTTCTEVFSRVRACEGKIKTIIAPLSLIQTMFRIESARLPEEMRLVSEGLIGEIAAVHHEVNKAFSEQLRIVTTTLETLQTVRERIHQQTAAIDSTLGPRKEQVAAAFARLTQELAKNSERDISLNSTSRDIRNSVSDIIMALQTHDIASQRLESVQAAISEARSLMSQTSASNADLQRSWFLLAVQQAQLESVRTQLEETETALQAAIKVVASKVVTLDSDCLMLKEFEEVTIASNGSVEVSLEMISDAEGLMQSAVSSSRDFYTYMEPLDQLSLELSNALERLAMTMHLIAMNAQIQAVHIGAGTGLEVLAENTAIISLQTTTVARDVSSGIAQVVSTVQSLTRSFREIITQGERTLGVLKQNSLPHQDHLHDLRNRSLTKLSKVGEAVDSIRDLTTTLAEESSVRQIALSTIADAVTSLDQITGDLKLNIGTIEVANLPTTGKYRMKSERDVHQALLKSLGAVDTDEDNADAEAGDAGEVKEPESLVELF